MPTFRQSSATSSSSRSATNATLVERLDSYLRATLV